MQIVLSASKSGTLAIVGVSSEPCGTPPECVIGVGEHDKISHTFYVRFEFAKLVSLQALRDGIKAGVIQPSSPVSPQLLERITAAVLASSRTRNEVKRHIQQG